MEGSYPRSQSPCLKDSCPEETFKLDSPFVFCLFFFFFFRSLNIPFFFFFLLLLSLNVLLSPSLSGYFLDSGPLDVDLLLTETITYLEYKGYHSNKETTGLSDCLSTLYSASGLKKGKKTRCNPFVLPQM